MRLSWGPRVAPQTSPQPQLTLRAPRIEGANGLIAYHCDEDRGPIPIGFTPTPSRVGAASRSAQDPSTSAAFLRIMRRLRPSPRLIFAPGR